MINTSLRVLAAASLLLCASGCYAQKNAPPLSITFDSRGLSSIRYQGVNYLGSGDFRLNAVKFQTAAGLVDGSPSGTCAMNRSAAQLNCSYPWGSIAAHYGVSDNRLEFAITTKNNSPNALAGLFLEPLAIRFPTKPSEYDGNTPILADNIGEPAVLKLTFGADALVLTDEDSLPLMIGFPFAADRPQSMTLFPLRINTGREATYPDSLPAINRPIAPGTSNTYHLSLRFGPAAMTRYEFASDVYSKFKLRFPQQLRWKDRRPIASLILGTTAVSWPMNPRGWLLDPNIDAFTASGIRNLRRRILDWADNSIAIMRRMNAQGMVTWDIEGEQYPQPTTYIGDPRLFEKLAPEMSDIADEYFEKFRKAGFRVGVCIRPQQLIIEGREVHQATATDPAALMIAKINYARQRWGATLFYVDSNGEPSSPMAPEIFARVAAAEPDVLLIPEHETLGYYSSTAPYNELRGGWTSSPPLVRKLYRDAFSVINIADGNIDANQAQLTQAVADGDILLFRGWYSDPNNAKVQALYRAVSLERQSADGRGKLAQ